MTYYIFKENGKLNGCGQCKQLTEGVENIEVTEEVYNAFSAEPEKFIYSDSGIIENPDYAKEQAQAREKTFDEEFFLTSLGYIRRRVTMKDGNTKDFLTDILPLLEIGVPIISYEKPNFFETDFPTQNKNKIVFISLFLF